MPGTKYPHQCPHFTRGPPAILSNVAFMTFSYGLG